MDMQTFRRRWASGHTTSGAGSCKTWISFLNPAYETDIRLIAVSHGNTNIFHLVFDLVLIFQFQFYLTRSNARPAQIQCFGEGK